MRLKLTRIKKFKSALLNKEIKLKRFSYILINFNNIIYQ